MYVRMQGANFQTQRLPRFTANRMSHTRDIAGRMTIDQSRCGVPGTAGMPNGPSDARRAAHVAFV